MSASWFDGVTLTVEVGFASDASTAIGSTTWTDVTADVRALEWRYGRSSETDDITPGVASVVLDNRTRQYDPDNTASPYDGFLLPMRRIRIRATYATVIYDLWSGFVEAWPQTYWQDADATVTVPCVDATAVLAVAELEANAVEAAVMALAPTAFYQMDDRTAVVRRKARIGTTRSNEPNRLADASGNGNTATIAPAVGLFDAAYLTEAEPLVYGGQAIRFGGTTGGYGYNVYADTKPDAGPISMSLWFATSAPVGTTTDLVFPIAQACADDGDLFRLAVFVRHHYETGAAVVEVTATHTTGTKYVAQVPYEYGRPCFVGASVAATGTPVIVINGESLGASSGFYPSVTNGGSEFGRLLGPGYEIDMTTWTLALTATTYERTVTFDEWALWAGTKLTAAQLQGIYYAGADARDNERSGSRVGYVLDAADWPSADRTLDDGETWLGPLSTTDGSALDALNEIQQAEQGRIFVAPSGKVTFQSRSHDPGEANAGITWVGASAQAASNTLGGTLTTALPAGVAAGDQIVLIMAGNVDFDLYPPAVTGYTVHHIAKHSGSLFSLAVLTKTAGAAEADPSVTVPGGWVGTGDNGGVSMQVLVARNVAAVGTVVESESVAATTWSPTGITTSTANAWAVSFVGSRDNNALGYSDAAGFTDRMSGVDYDTTTGGDHAIGVATLGVTTAGAVTMPTWQQTANNDDIWLGVSFDLTPASAVTFTDALYGELDLETTRATIRNRITVLQESSGSAYLAEDSTSQGAYLRADETLSVNAHAGSYCSALASWRLARYKNPLSRITALRFPGRKNATTITQALVRQVGDLVTVTRTPQGVGSAISKTLVIEGVSHSMNALGAWDVEWYLSPGPNTGPWLTLDDATLGKLGATAGNKLHF